MGCSLDIPIWVALSISLLDSVLSIRPSIPRRLSVSCIGCKVTFHRGVVSYTTGLTRWSDRSGASVSLIIYIVRVGIVWNFIVAFAVCLSTTIVFAIIFGTILVISDLVFFSFELKALIPIVTWLFEMVAGWFGLFRVLLWGLMYHSVDLHFIWGFQTIQFQLLFKMRHNLFICAILQMRLVNWFLQVESHFGIDELLDDRLSINSECIFR